jgi:Na+/glutamate symporter
LLSSRLLSILYTFTVEKKRLLGCKALCGLLSYGKASLVGGGGSALAVGVDWEEMRTLKRN